jgi:hypothetical protein
MSDGRLSVRCCRRHDILWDAIAGFPQGATWSTAPPLPGFFDGAMVRSASGLEKFLTNTKEPLLAVPTPSMVVAQVLFIRPSNSLLVDLNQSKRFLAAASSAFSDDCFRFKQAIRNHPSALSAYTVR